MFQAKLEMQHCHCRHFSCPAWSRYLDRIVVGSNEIIPHHMSCNPRWNSKPAKRRFKVGMPWLMRGKLVFRSNLKWASRMSLHAGISNYPSPVSISAKRTDCRVSKWYDFSVLKWPNRGIQLGTPQFLCLVRQWLWVDQWVWPTMRFPESTPCDWNCPQNQNCWINSQCGTI